MRVCGRASAQPPAQHPRYRGDLHVVVRSSRLRSRFRGSCFRGWAARLWPGCGSPVCLREQRRHRRADGDHVPGRATDSYAMQSWASVGNEAANVLLSSVDAPIIAFGTVPPRYVAGAHHCVTSASGPPDPFAAHRFGSGVQQELLPVLLGDPWRACSVRRGATLG